MLKVRNGIYFEGIKGGKNYVTGGCGTGPLTLRYQFADLTHGLHSEKLWVAADHGHPLNGFYRLSGHVR